MTTEKRGAVSHLKDVLVKLERATGQKLTNRDVADKAGISEHTFGTWVKPYRVIQKIDVNTWYTITDALNKIAQEAGADFRVKPEDILTFTGWSLEGFEDPETEELLEAVG